MFLGLLLPCKVLFPLQGSKRQKTTFKNALGKDSGLRELELDGVKEFTIEGLAAAIATKESELLKSVAGTQSTPCLGVPPFP